MAEKESFSFFYQLLGKLIRDKRVAMKISQDELSKNIKMSRVSVVNIEKGIQKVQIHTLVELAKILEINLNDLKILLSTESNNTKLDKNYQSRIDKSEVGDVKNLKKNLENLKKHL